jgi:hypothetical protein
MLHGCFSFVSLVSLSFVRCSPKDICESFIGMRFSNTWQFIFLQRQDFSLDRFLCFFQSEGMDTGFIIHSATIILLAPEFYI